MFGQRIYRKRPVLQAKVKRNHGIIHLTGSVDILINDLEKRFYVALHIKDFVIREEINWYCWSLYWKPKEQGVLDTSTDNLGRASSI